MFNRQKGTPEGRLNLGQITTYFKTVWTRLTSAPQYVLRPEQQFRKQVNDLEKSETVTVELSTADDSGNISFKIKIGNKNCGAVFSTKTGVLGILQKEGLSYKLFAEVGEGYLDPVIKDPYCDFDLKNDILTGNQFDNARQLIVCDKDGNPVEKITITFPPNSELKESLAPKSSIQNISVATAEAIPPTTENPIQEMPQINN